LQSFFIIYKTINLAVNYYCFVAAAAAAPLRVLPTGTSDAVGVRLFDFPEAFDDDDDGIGCGTLWPFLLALVNAAAATE
jgi:hypothetical protein